VQPGSLRAWAGLASDRWVSGDRNAQLIGWQALLERDPPNYCIVFTTAGE
jgi:hypothetical protein